jgi:hypothetical protein
MPRNPRTPVNADLWIARRSRCTAHAAAHLPARCAPGEGDTGVCHGTGPAAHTPRRTNRALRAVCRLWWRGLSRSE